MQRTNKALGQGLYHSRRHRASSERGLESPGRKVSSAGFHAPENQPEREIRERDRETEIVSNETVGEDRRFQEEGWGTQQEHRAYLQRSTVESKRSQERWLLME